MFPPSLSALLCGILSPLLLTACRAPEWPELPQNALTLQQFERSDFCQEYGCRIDGWSDLDPGGEKLMALHLAYVAVRHEVTLSFNEQRISEALLDFDPTQASKVSDPVRFFLGAFLPAALAEDTARRLPVITAPGVSPVHLDVTTSGSPYHIVGSGLSMDEKGRDLSVIKVSSEIDGESKARNMYLNRYRDARHLNFFPRPYYSTCRCGPQSAFALLGRLETGAVLRPSGDVPLMLVVDTKRFATTSATEFTAAHPAWVRGNILRVPIGVLRDGALVSTAVMTERSMPQILAALHSHDEIFLGGNEAECRDALLAPPPPEYSPACYLQY